MAGNTGWFRFILIIQTYLSSNNPHDRPCEVGIAIFLAVICPGMLYFLHRVHDAYGIRNDILVTTLVGGPGLILFYVWEFQFDGRIGWWNQVNWWVFAIIIQDDQCNFYK